MSVGVEVESSRKWGDQGCTTHHAHFHQLIMEYSPCWWEQMRWSLGRVCSHRRSGLPGRNPSQCCGGSSSGWK